MWEGTTSRVMATDRSYGEFYDFYSVGLEYFGLDVALYNELDESFEHCQILLPAVSILTHTAQWLISARRISE
jgi:hypothetical protein